MGIREGRERLPIGEDKEFLRDGQPQETAHGYELGHHGAAQSDAEITRALGQLALEGAEVDESDGWGPT